MASWIITGASGSLASACIEVLLAKGKVVYGFSRKMVEDDRILFKQVPNYYGIKFDTENCEGLLVAQGHFLYEHLDSMSVSEVSEIVDANFRSQIHVVHSFLQQVNKNKRTNIIILGSTSAYEAGAGTVIYGAAKAGMLAFVKALNKEYIETDIRLWFISTGTLANEMGAKVPNQDPNSLLDPALVAKRIIEAVTDESNLWEPEITIRRRHIKLVN
jgi:NADP-dependent 3-hydroxy acid dehydrogenase YdfG